MDRLVGGSIHAYETVDSTQTVLARFAREGAPEGTLVSAAHQTVGRGRRGHRWWDASGDSLLMSILLRPCVTTQETPSLALVAGLAVADALEAVATVAARIRWPNDVLVGGKKISGVLPEAVSGADGRVAYVLLGIGINIDQDVFPDDLRDEAISLRQATGVRHEQGRVRDAVLESLDLRYAEWLSAGFPRLRDAWRRRACTLGERVRGADGTEGVAVDVDDTGALLVDAGHGALARVISSTTALAPSSARARSPSCCS